MSTWVVTGGAGFIGTHTVRELLGRGGRVRVLDNFATGRRSNLAGLQPASALEVIESDIRDRAACSAVLRDADYVIHLAALGSIPRSIEDPLTANEVNVNGTLNLLDAARSAGVRRFVFGGSSSSYGDNLELPKHESQLGRPLSPYAIAKLTGELYARVYHELFGLPVVCLRYFNVFGPGQDPDSPYAAVIPRFFRALYRGEPPVIYGDGEQTRDFTYVANTVQANLGACEAGDACLGRVFNIAGGERTSINALLARIRELTGASVDPQYVPARAGDIRDSMASIDLAGEYLGYRPAIDVSEGLKRTAAWYAERER